MSVFHPACPSSCLQVAQARELLKLTPEAAEEGYRGERCEVVRLRLMKNE